MSLIWDSMACVGERKSVIYQIREFDLENTASKWRHHLCRLHYSQHHCMKELIFSSLCRWPICSSGHSCSSQMKETHPAFSSQSTDRFHHQTFSSRTTKTSNFLCTGLERNISWCNEWAVYSFRPVWSLFGPFKPQCGLLNSIVLYKTPVFICTLFIPAWSKIIRPGNFL